MFAVGVGNAVEDELREIASEPVAEHYFYTADFKTINQIGKKLQKRICRLVLEALLAELQVRLQEETGLGGGDTGNAWGPLLGNAGSESSLQLRL